MAIPFSLSLDGRTVHVRGDLDIATAPEFERAVAGLLADPGDVVLEASAMSFIDSSGIRVVLGLARQLQGRGRLAIENASEQVLRVLDLVHAETFVDVRVRAEGNP